MAYKFHLRKNAYHKDFIHFFVPIELYGTQEVFRLWKLYDKKF